MATIDIVLLTISGVAAIGIVGILVRHFPQLVRIDVARFMARQEAEKKRALLEERLRRKLLVALVRVRLIARPLGTRIARSLRSLLEHLRNLEHAYAREGSRRLTPKDRASVEQKVRVLLSQGEEYLKQEDYMEAERRFVEAIALNPSHVESYKALSVLYIEKKEYDQAKEILKHILKLNHDDPQAYSSLGLIESQLGHLDEAEQDYLRSVALAQTVASYHHELGLVYRAKGEAKKALAQFSEAVSLDPSNPKYLHYQIEEAIAAGDKKVAHDAYRRLRGVNPENQKLAELKTRIDELAQKSAH